MTSLGMPGISEGFHAKMSLLPWRKSTSALSYAEESAVPIRTFFALGATGIQEDLPGAFCRFERSRQLLCVGCPFNDLLPEGDELFGCDDYGCVSAAFDLALVSALEGGADGDDPMGTRHLQLQVRVIGYGHELRVAWSPQDGVESPREPHYIEGEGLSPVIGPIPKSDGQVDLP